MQIAHGFMASKHLFAASELGLFEALGEGPVDLDGLAARTGLTRRAARISADAMVAIGLLDKLRRPLRQHAGSGRLLVRGDPGRPATAAEVLGPAELPRLGRTRRSARPWPADPADLRHRRGARADHVRRHRGRHLGRLPMPFPPRQACRPGSSLLDIGGGTGSWAIALAATDPALTATVLELADVAAVAEEPRPRVRILRPDRRPRRGPLRR